VSLVRRAIGFNDAVRRDSSLGRRCLRELAEAGGSVEVKLLAGGVARRNVEDWVRQALHEGLVWGDGERVVITPAGLHELRRSDH